jgi:hypothetical protein
LNDLYDNVGPLPALDLIFDQALEELQARFS